MSDPKYEARLIAGKIKPLFTQMNGDRYQLQIVKDDQAHQFAFFFMRQPRRGSMLIKPIYQIEDYNLEYLEAVLTELKQYYQFTNVYRGFIGDLWPSNGEPIQKKKAKDEM